MVHRNAVIKHVIEMSEERYTPPRPFKSYSSNIILPEYDTAVGVLQKSVLAMCALRSLVYH